MNIIFGLFCFLDDGDCVILCGHFEKLFFKIGFNLVLKLIINFFSFYCMKTQSVDTYQKAEEVQISLLRKASTSNKFSQVRSLSQITLQLSRRAITRANEDLSERQIDLLFISLHYGKELSNNLDKYLNSVAHESS